MFDDIYDFEKKIKEVDLYDYRLCPRCINCGSIDFKNIRGKFLSRFEFKETMKCNNCGSEWYVTLDQNLRILRVEKEI